jgi:hypothetical protein
MARKRVSVGSVQWWRRSSSAGSSGSGSGEWCIVGSVDKPADCRRVCFSGAGAEFTVPSAILVSFAMVERVRTTRLAEWACDTLNDDGVRADHAQLPSGTWSAWRVADKSCLHGARIRVRERDGILAARGARTGGR